MKSTIIGITGASGSGKTFFSQNVREKLSQYKLAHLTLDSYYKNLAHLPLEKRHQVNFDHPDSLDYDLLIEHLNTLKKQESIKVPVYDYENHVRSSNYHEVNSADIYIIEGILLFNHEVLNQLIDVKIFIDTPLDICLFRRINRDMELRGRSLESILEQYNRFVRPMYFTYVEPTKRYANIVVPNHFDNTIGTTMITYALKQILEFIKQKEHVD